MIPAPVLLDARTATPHFPGIGRSVIGLARAFADGAAAPAPALIHAPIPDPRLPIDVLRGVTCGASPFGLRQQWEVRRLLRAHGAALYHSPYYLMPYAPGVPAIVTCHDLMPLTIDGLFGPSRRLAYRLAHAMAFRAACAISVPSKATAREVAAHFPAHAEKVHVIPWGSAFGPAAAEGAGRDLPPQPYVLAVGSNKPHKDLATLLEAWTRVAARRRGKEAVRLVLAGGRDPRWPERGGAEALRRSGGLVATGEVSDEALAGLYRHAALFVLPSRAEGFGLPALEAMSLGAPAVCSRIDALTELCDDAAAFFTPGDAGQLAGLLDHLLDTPEERDRLRHAGLRRASAFTWARAARATGTLYERAIREGRAV